jgi:sialate O-acetylesterase
VPARVGCQSSLAVIIDRHSRQSPALGAHLVILRSRFFRCAFSAVLGATALAATPRAHADVTLPHLLSDHAVLQRDKPLHLWGSADPGEAVSVSLHGQAGHAVADGLGHWSIYLQPESAGGPYTLTVKGNNTLTLRDILIGDVWFASGQSNMELPLKGFPGSAVLKNGPEEIAAANHPEIRLLHIPNTASSYELHDEPATWAVCTPESATSFSAVAYFFGRGLQQELHVPIGLIDSTWGGTPISSWISMDGLSGDAGLMPEFAARATMVQNQTDVPAMLAREKRQDAAAKEAGAPIPIHAWHPNPDSWEPASLFNGMVAPALDYTIKGVIWYQGETDSSPVRAPLYELAFPSMITDWRMRWQQGNFPFLFVQISSFTSTPYEAWAIIREAQRRTLKLAGTAMAVTTDIGEAGNVHPPDKQTVGKRLDLAAQAIAYGKRLEFSGPVFEQAVPQDKGMRVYFTHASGLLAKGGALEGFEVAGADHRFEPATAVIDAHTGNGVAGSTVVVRSEAIEHPVYVRYAWANAPLNANLYNSADLPASTFTSEEHMPAPCMQNCGH